MNEQNIPGGVGVRSTSKSRECDCPEWVGWCAHLPDGTLLITTKPGFENEPYPGYRPDGSFKPLEDLKATNPNPTEEELHTAFREFEGLLLQRDQG